MTGRYEVRAVESGECLEKCNSVDDAKKCITEHVWYGIANDRDGPMPKTFAELDQGEVKKWMAKFIIVDVATGKTVEAVPTREQVCAAFSEGFYDALNACVELLIDRTGADRHACVRSIIDELDRAYRSFVPENEKKSLWELSDCTVTDEGDVFIVWYPNEKHQFLAVNNDADKLRAELDRIEAEGGTITGDWEDGIGNTVCIENGVA